jgi:hypothetical protein
MFSTKSKLLIIFIILTYCRLVNAADHFLCSYGINNYTYYKSDGTKVVVDNPSPADPTIATNIFNFIYPKVKLAVASTISGFDGNPYAVKNIPYLAYDSGGLFNTDPISGGTWGMGHLNPTPPDSYFLYDSFTQSKLIMSKYGTFTYPNWIYDITNTDLRNRYTDYLKTVTDPQSSGCGLMLDDTIGYLADYAWTRLVSESKVIAYCPGSTEYLYINGSHNLSPKADEVNYQVLDSANDDKEIPSIGCWQNPWGKEGFYVFFNNPAYDKKTVTLKYYERITKYPPYQVSHSDFTFIDDTAYRNGMTSFLQQLKGKVGNNQLVFYNGSIPNLQTAHGDYDVDFLNYADGCMAENIFNPNNWHADSDKTLWKAGLDKEIQIAALNKKLLSLNYTYAESDSDIIKDMFLYYASFLLGAGNGSMFSFTSKLGQFMWFDFYDYDIGVPSGPYTKSIDSNTAQPFDENTYVFQRSFANGLVLVNVEPITLTAKVPTGNYYYFDSNTNWVLKSVSSSITIPPRTGSILFKKAPNLNVNVPNGGESWARNSMQYISWSNSGSLEKLKLTLWQNSALIGTIAENVNPAAGSYRWSTGAYTGGVATLGTGYKIKIERQSTGISVESSGPFSIVKLSVKMPNGGESWQIGTTQNITWVAKSISGNLRIVLFKDGLKVGNIANNIDPLLGTYSWSVGQHDSGTATAGTGYQVQVREIETEAGDRSDAFFTLTTP